MSRVIADKPRGPLTDQLLNQVQQRVRPVTLPAPTADDILTDEDEALALYLCYQLHYPGLPGVDDGWEWEPSLLTFRRRLEERFIRQLRESTTRRSSEDLVTTLYEVLESDPAPSVSKRLATMGTRRQLREFAVHRSAYQLKEADPHTWAIPRLAGGPKAALVRLQYDEYGSGVADEMHASLFSLTMTSLGLDARYGAYLNVIPAITLSSVNLISLFGLHRRWRGALVGHLAIFEMSSVVPNRRYATAVRRLGYGEAPARFFDIHVEADAEHQFVAAYDLAQQLSIDEPSLVADIIFGAQSLCFVEGR
jgi:hypothetical protein